MSTEIKPTPEQLDTLAKVVTRKPVTVKAYAGCGKTTMLKMICRANPRLAFVYLAFGTQTAADARLEFPSNATCTTVHSMAYRALIRTFGRDKMGGRLSGGFVAAKLGLRDVYVAPSPNERPIKISARGFGFLMCGTITRFCQSGDQEIAARHVPKAGLLDEFTPEVLRSFRESVAKKARELWAQMIDPAALLPLGHDGYLKLWALGRPVIPGDCILLDEAQDTNGVVLELLRHQRAQIVCVGDSHQQIYEWRGAVNAMDILPSDLEGRLTTSWRFGPRIAGYASSILRLLGETIPLKGNPAREDRIDIIEGCPDAILARTNARLLDEIQAALRADLKPCVVGGTRELQQIIDAHLKLKAGHSVDLPLEFFGFPNWQAVVEASEGPDGAELQRWVKFFEDCDPEELRAMLASLPENEAGADVILSTGHKAKGREWDRVRLCDDFLRGIGETNQDGTPKLTDPAAVAAELRLFYVAATRGKVHLEVPPTLSAKLSTLVPPAKAAAPAPTRVHVAAEPVPAPRLPADDEFEPIDVPTPVAARPERTSADDEFAPIDPPAKGETPATDAPRARRKRFNAAEWELIGEALRAMVPGLPAERRALGERALSKLAA